MAKQSKINWDEPEEVYAPTHDFEKVPIVEGTLVKEGTITVRGDEVSFVVLDTADGEETVWLGSVLKSSLEDGHAEMGSYIGVKYLGMVKGAAGFKYRNYTVRVLPKEE
jgi:hypothetical protein